MTRRPTKQKPKNEQDSQGVNFDRDQETCSKRANGECIKLCEQKGKIKDSVHTHITRGQKKSTYFTAEIQNRMMMMTECNFSSCRCANEKTGNLFYMRGLHFAELGFKVSTPCHQSQLQVFIC